MPKTTIKKSIPFLEKLTWKQARAEVAQTNPTLAHEIDKLDPDDQYLLIKARYPFGSKILDKGVLHLPGKNHQLLSIDNPDLDPAVKSALSYAQTMPMGIVLNNSIELYLMENNRAVTFSLMTTGKIFALWTVLESSQSTHLGHIWNISAGARSVMMLPKISDITFYKKLKREFDLFSSVPKEFLDQWEIFKELSQSPLFPEPWAVDMLFFSGKWLENRTDPKWQLFRQYLRETAWHETAYLRNQVMVDFAFSCALEARNLKPNPYLTDTVKHLYSIGIGTYPGFVVAQNSIAAPIRGLQAIFTDIYNLRYSPTMIQPGYISTTSMENPCYYSLAVPTLMVFSPKSRKFNSKLEDLREIRHIMHGVSSYLLEDKLKLVNTPIYKWAKDIEYGYFHSETDDKESIHNSGEIVKKDTALIDELQRYPQKSFCATSPFLRGCIRISTKSGRGGGICKPSEP